MVELIAAVGRSGLGQVAALGRAAVGIICSGGLLSLLLYECYDGSVMLRTLR